MSAPPFDVVLAGIPYCSHTHQVDRAFAHKNACNDWARDNADGGATMSYDIFVESIFELVSSQRAVQ